MRMINFRIAALVLGMTLLFVSCTDESDDNGDSALIPTEMEDDGEWYEDEIATSEVLWYKVSCDANATAVTLEWSELEAHGEDRDYTADIVVSAYQMDGVTAYIEDKDNGYKESGKTFDLGNGEVQFLVKVLINSDNNTAGTFALRVKSQSDITVTYTDLSIGANWNDSTIAVGEVIAYKVKYTGEKLLKVYWAESGTPEEGYTADISGSVLNKDANAYYAVYANGSGYFQDKKKSHSDDAKVILTNAEEGNFKIHITGVTAGTFAIKVEEVQ